ncbi:UDP-GlcNAc:undecaprenyl-phosphate GlcNAc-1-phosphate transferase [Anaerobacterium chartisolvens]|uniref:UDP-GlcNAc:undecaprenyl-phosphate GlcNAc-1-phosphate transferase n=1 Tax=Anaerobacterium chartisolvens TaxID=1297424 RepID=A0A369B182_9FIRM|nr:MraY family glycosyltransferase [Anaerobacterium chartisolvens]RCX14328.1 UDP-GlcNAc:undecaprenyl-phosphate GlcNAc-1-phosphate transferase [Anaerobacterium chartisolvens]
MIYEYFISFILSFIVAFSATPIAKKVAFKWGAIDVPRDNRRMHKKPIARLGGLAIVSGFLVAILFTSVSLYISASSAFKPNFQFIGFLVGVLIITVIGIIDDIKQVRARYKLVFQITAACIVAFTGTRIGFVTNPFSSIGISELNPVISYGITILWIVGITNAVNLIDGLDGLAAGVSSIASLSLFFISIILERWDIAIVTAALAGSALGFLPYNFNPAKIFMGDTGSNFLGFALGVISIQGTLKSYAAIAIAIPLLVLGLPLFDTSFAIIRRIINKKPIMEPDRGHLHHRLIDMGLSHRQSVVVMYTVSATLGLCAIVLADKGVLSAIILVLAISVFVIAGARYMSEITTRDDEELEEVPENDPAKNSNDSGDGDAMNEGISSSKEEAPSSEEDTPSVPKDISSELS